MSLRSITTPYAAKGRVFFSTLIVLLLSFTENAIAQAQEPIRLEASRSGMWYELTDSVLAISNMRTGEQKGIAVDGWLSSPVYRENIRQSTIVATDSVLLVWDRSVGSVSTFNTRTGDFTTDLRLPSTNQFDHAADVSHSGELYVFGGYGNFRLSNMLLQYEAERGNWIELEPVGSKVPSPRNYAVLVADGYADALYLIGGTGASSTPARRADTALFDAWIFDLKTNKWKQTGMTPWLACSLNEYRFASFRPTALRNSRGVPVLVPSNCLAEVEDVQEGLYVWYPFEKRVEMLLDQRETFHSGVRPVAWDYSEDGSELRLFFIDNMEGWVSVSVPLDGSIEQFDLPLPFRGLLFVLLTTALVFGLIVLFFVSRRFSISVRPSKEQLIIRKGFSVHHEALSLNASLILGRLALLDSPTMKPFRREQIEDAIGHLYHDADTCRNAVSRALTECNQIVSAHIGKELLEKMPDPSDGRRYLYLSSIEVQLLG